MIETIGSRYPNCPPSRRALLMKDMVDRLNADHARNTGGPFTPLPAPSRVSREKLQAFVSADRWVVECRCASAQLADPEDPRFYCVECLNFEVGGAFYRVEFPDPIMRAAIQREVDKFKSRGQRNWRPGWTLEDIRRGSVAVGGPRR